MRPDRYVNDFKKKRKSAKESSITMPHHETNFEKRLKDIIQMSCMGFGSRETAALKH
ncbi:hypothetical protein D1AOALGA4SA_4938 [Olavius algarvensis Delta 1 endosymbiont]|nr:hypothetical protein D1AOALGA4SA_4938 [Olavius algarvensis Delta 1 endosymbiont]